ncbi:MAG TPA: flagellar hook-length control protein FliK [Chitinolyticbacter sp.]|nr:flagellar hook-length control protein FliK [Chitinolyticbacter sp.]
MPSAVHLISNSQAANKSAKTPAPAAKGEEAESFGKVFADEMNGDGKALPLKQKQGKASADTPDLAGRVAAHAWLAELQLSANPDVQAIKLPVASGLDSTSDPVAAMKAWLAGATGKPGAAGKEEASTASQLAQASVKEGKAELAADGKVLPLAVRSDGEELPVDAETAPPMFRAASETTSQPSVAKSETPAVKPSHYVPEPVGSNRWGDAVAQRVALMLGKQEQQIEMQLNPPHLGPMEVRLSLAADNASVVFASQHAGVREALAAATPRLSALLADQGIQLVNVQVASDTLNQHTQQQQASAGQQQGGGQSQGPAGLHGDQAETISVEQLSGAVHLPVARTGLSLYA